jgi:hypothetical protein
MYRGPIVLPAPIVTEVAYFLRIEPGPAAEAAFLDALASCLSTVFGWAERAPVAFEERVSQVWPTWPGAEPETNEVAGGQIDTRVLEVDDRDVARRADQPVAGLEV